ncbi:amidohydrolase family protein [Chryseobacterium rhizoplanae]|uniref:amidohydrolase family protein n=1 Tax=Chryseobacterium rhizoplanae TaxID=1609531 RepID=UPI001CE385F5|nr:amidohydrolase family protein [Chryseobacterium rhizoplanae]UCA61777.1 amidohydrolase family protein [Chryseobacterium rhizoplanae]
MSLILNSFFKIFLGVLLVGVLFSSCYSKKDIANSNTLLIKNALIIPMDAKQDTCFSGYLVVNNKGNIQEIKSGLPSKNITAQKVIDAKGLWIIPGFISAHSHLWQSGFTGIAPNENLEGWVDKLYGVEAPKFSPEGMYSLAYRGAKDHLKNGITTVYNFTYTGSDTTLAVDKMQLQAAIDANIRVIHGFNVLKISDHWTPEQAERRISKFLNWTKEIKDPNSCYLSTMIAGYAVYEDSSFPQAVVESKLMKKFNLYNQQHYLESLKLVEGEQKRFKWLLDTGMINSKMIFGHFIHPSPYILDMAAANKVSMVWNPLSNGRLGSGIPDILLYKSKNIKIGMGVDGAASADRSDPFENMRTGLYYIRAMKQKASVMKTYEVLRMHTMGSAEVLNIQEYVGSLTQGKKADFLLIDPSSFSPYKKPYDALVFAAGPNNIKKVYVGGVEIPKEK